MAQTLYTDRELSWIQFNKRVLEESGRGVNPLIERLRFISIFQSNFDEFYRVRVGSITDKMLVEEDPDKKQQLKEQLAAIFKATKKLLPELDHAFEQAIADGAPYFTRITEQNMTQPDRAYLKQLFEREIAPLISPFIVEKKHPFPFIDNGLRVMGVTIKKKNGGSKFGMVPIRSQLPRAVFLPGGDCRFMLIEDVISLFAYKIFHRFEITEKIVFTIIRNADIDENEGLYDFDVDFRETMSKLVELRRKLAPVALKYTGENCDKILNHLKNVLYLTRKQLFRQSTPQNMKFVSLMEKRLPKDRLPDLYYTPVTATYPAALQNTDLIQRIRERDRLLCYPFDDVQVLIDLIDQAAHDPRVDEIMITLYRVASDSKLVEGLIDAARRGKRVSCMVELRARFDEENNIDWSKRLQDAGCRVFYGLPNYKVHCKLLIIATNDGGGDLVQVGTGNFNEVTARQYTDLALFTAHPGIVKDAKDTFACLEAGRFVEHSDHLLVAPLCLKTRLIQLIDEEIAKKQAGKPAGILLKMNSLTDKDLIAKLIEASKAGVRVRMVIRGICCLVPGVPGETENIEVRSIVGRFLEHSRIYVFGAGSARKYYISSADFMTRNTTQRVEVAVPVYDYRARLQLGKIMRLALRDNQKARVLRRTGKYVRPYVSPRATKHNMQMELFDQDA